MEEHLDIEGWFKDPFGQHEARWFSDGKPTALVKDGGTESHDPPPDDHAAAGMRPEELPEADGPDMARAGDDDTTPADAVFNTIAVAGYYPPKKD